MNEKFYVGDIVKIKNEYYVTDPIERGEIVGVITEITRSVDHSIESIRKLESHTGHKIDIIRVMTNDGTISEWFDDELEILGEKE